MNFLFDEDQDLLRASARGRLQRDYPAARIRELSESPSGFDGESWRRGAELGLFAMLVDPDLGGGSVTDQPLVDAVVLGEEVGRAMAPGPFVATNVVAWTLSTFGSPEQLALAGTLAAGERVATWCVAETGADYDRDALTTTARRDGDGWVIDGAKVLVEGAGVADDLLVVARSGEEVVQVLVPATTDGVSITSQHTLDLTRRLDAVTFAAVTIPAGAAVAVDAAGFDRQLQIAAVLTCADSLGGSDAVFEQTLTYTKQREQFGRLIASFQAIKHRCADVHVLLEGARAATHYAALAVANDQADAALAVSIAKAYMCEAYVTITGEGTQLHGGMGFTWEHDMHLYVRRAWANEVLYGSPSWYRNRSWRALEAGRTEELV